MSKLLLLECISWWQQKSRPFPLHKSCKALNFHSVLCKMYKICSCPPPAEQCILQGNMLSKWDFNRSLSSIDQWVFHTFCSHSLPLKDLTPYIWSKVRAWGRAEESLMSVVCEGNLRLHNKALLPISTYIVSLKIYEWKITWEGRRR